jgi:hypothetical protein
MELNLVNKRQTLEKRSYELKENIKILNRLVSTNVIFIKTVFIILLYIILLLIF